MEQILHGRATTTAETRRVIQQSQERLRALSRRCMEEAAIVAFRKHALLPLDDGLYATVFINRR